MVDNRNFSLTITYLYLQWILNYKELDEQKRKELLDYPDLSQYVKWRTVNNRIVVTQVENFKDVKYRDALNDYLR